MKGSPIWRWLGLITVGWLLVCAGVLGFLHEQIRPDEADPALREVARSTSSDRGRPRAAPLPAPLASGCAVSVEVVDDAGDPVDDAELVLGLHDPQTEGAWREEAFADGDGRQRWEGLPCVYVELAAEAQGYTRSYANVYLSEPGQEEAVRITLLDGLMAEGRVTDPDGRPVEGALVQSGTYEALTDGRGRYEINLDYALTTDEEGQPRGMGYLFADALGYEENGVNPFEAVGLGAPDGREVYEVDLELTAVREVLVHCVGLPNDDCETVMVACTHPYQPFADSCFDHDPIDSGTTCRCPVDGTVAIRGGGRSVLVPADEDEAWLDFRDTGSLVGRVEVDGEPAAYCRVNLLRLPHGLEDVPRGLVNAHRVSCEADGSFEAVGLSEGDWEAVITGSGADGESRERTTLPRVVREGKVTDLGVVDLMGGGIIEGVLLDGLTGSPASHEPVIALRQGGEGERTTPMGTDTNPDGGFVLEGLPAGTWHLSHLLSPHEYTVVEVEDGYVSDGVEVLTSDATALETNGFDLVQEEEGALVVDFVDTGSPAMDGGLEAGDEVTGVLLAGFDVVGMAGDDAPEITRFILGHWDGPGVTLVVEREGEELEVPLDW